MRGSRITFGALLAGAALALGSPAARAQTTSSECDVRVGGHAFEQGAHVGLPNGRKATIAVAAFEEKPRYRVELDLAGVRSTVGTGQGKDFGWRRDINIPQYADYGVGTYRLHVITTVAGKPCQVTGLIDITGRAPVTTLTGGLAVLAALLGLLGLVTVLLRRGGRAMRTRHAFGVDDPLGEFGAVNTPGDYVGWAEVACDLGARTFVTVKPGGDAVREFMDEPSTHVRLAGIRNRGVGIKAGDTGTPMPRITWRPRVALVGPLLGILAAAAVLVYLQQAAVLYPTPTLAAITLGTGLVAGMLIANLARFLGKVSLNRRLAAAVTGLDEETVEPRYPPLDHLDELDHFVWTPTHTVPDEGDGLPAWEDADRTGKETATLDPGLQVKVVETRDGLAQVVCSNGWVGWTDAEPLEEITS